MNIPALDNFPPCNRIKHMKNLILLFLLIISSCISLHDGLNLNPLHAGGTDKKADDFMLGWYISNEEKMIDFAVNSNDNPYVKLYNTYIVYSHNRYNKENNLLLLDPEHIHSYANQYPHINFIADLPRYSTLYRNIMIPGSNDASPLMHPYIETFIMDENSNRINKSYSPDIYRTEQDSAIFVYDFGNIYPHYGAMYLNTAFFSSKGQASVYRHADILDFASKSLADSASLCILINIKTDNGIKTLGITDDSAFLHIYSMKRDIICDTLIHLVKNPIWHVYSVNLDSIIKEEYTIKDMILVSRNTLLGPFVFKYSFEHAFEICRHFIDSLSNKDNIIGFYTTDEIQYKEMLCLDRWTDKTLTDKTSYRLLDLVEHINQYSEHIGKPAFSLSSAGFHDITGFSMNQNEYSSINRYIRIFDTYSYRDDYVHALLSAAEEGSGTFNIIVNDAYSTSSRKALPFHLTKFKFFLPIITGMDGMIFYTYALPRIQSTDELINDTSKVNVGELARFANSYNMFMMYRDSRHFKTENRISAVMGNGDMALFMYGAVNGHDNYYNPKGSAVFYDFSQSDDDIDYLLSLLHDDADYIVTDISPYSTEKYRSSDTMAFISSYRTGQIESVLDMINHFPFNSLLHIYDIRIIAIVRRDYYASIVSNEEAGSILFPQLIMPGSMTIDARIVGLERKLHYMDCLENIDFVSTLPVNKNSSTELLFKDFSGMQYRR